MIFETLEDMGKHVASLPRDLQDVWMRNWDDTGRPIRDPLGVHLDLLNLCVETSFDDYKAKYSILMHKFDLSEVEIRTLQEYWTVFIEGSKALARMIERHNMALAKEQG